MKPFRCWTFIACLSFAAVGYSQVDSTSPKIEFVSIQKGVKLEVLDWGGNGRPLILLPGLGDTAHVFDKFAAKLTSNYHVFGITPRGFGASSAPPPVPANYSVDRLSKDVVAVIDSLKLDRPILAGHSIAGEILSAVGTDYPDSVSALIYIDAGYAYALYDQAHGDLVLDAIALRNELDRLALGSLPRSPVQLHEVLIDTHRLESELQQREEDLSQLPTPHPIDNPISEAILNGQRKFTQLRPPVLAIFNVPHSPAFKRTMENQAQAFEVQVPDAHIVRIENADHYIFESKEAEVTRDINQFIESLAQP